LKRNKKSKCDHSHVLSCLHFLFSQPHFSTMAPCLFLLKHLFCLRKIFLSVNRSGPGTNSTTNRKLYKALGQPHSPWCKQPLCVGHSKTHLYYYMYSRINDLMCCTCSHQPMSPCVFTAAPELL
jgi:hypothetical protein